MFSYTRDSSYHPNMPYQQEYHHFKAPVCWNSKDLSAPSLRDTFSLGRWCFVTANKIMVRNVAFPLKAPVTWEAQIEPHPGQGVFFFCFFYSNPRAVRLMWSLSVTDRRVALCASFCFLFMWTDWSTSRSFSPERVVKLVQCFSVVWFHYIQHLACTAYKKNVL